MNQWTPAVLKQLKKDGKIRDYHIHENKDNSKGTKIPASEKKSKQKNWLKLNLHYWAIQNKMELKSEHVFHPERDWRFDHAFEEIMVAIEYEGIFSEKSRHTTISGFIGDVEKYNAAQALGWRIIRLTAKDYKTVLKQLNHYVNTKNVHR